MFEWLKEGARGAVGAATKGVTEAAAALKALAESMAKRAAQAADLGRLLDILNKIPGVDFERREPDAAYLATLMAAFQMGELTLVITCTGPKSTDIDILRMMPLAAAEADALVGSPKFSATVLAEGQEGRPAVQMLMNKENLAQNYRHVSLDALIKGLTRPIENVPFVGGVLAAALGLVARPIAKLILDIIFTQAENVIRYARGNDAGLFEKLTRGKSMSNDVNRQWLLVKRPEGNIQADVFQLVEKPIPSPDQGQVLVRNLWLSFDPTQSGWMRRDTYIPIIPLGEVMRAASVGQVIESRHPDYKPGQFVQGAFGWQDYIATDGGGFLPMRSLPAGVAPNLALSLFGITGPTAYFGVLDVGQAKAGETFVVSGAAGATGSVAGQIAKIRGCRVIGTAGGKAKCDWLTNELGFDGVIDYQSEDVGARLSALCPDGIDVFFDNTGGVVLNEVLARLRLKARIVLCGSISRYNDATPAPGPSNYSNLTVTRSRMEGFIVLDYAARFPEAIGALAGWLKEGKLKQKEDVAIGLENAPDALVRLFTGQNFGKQLLKIADPPLERVG